jgi:hypothetical protein
MAEKASKKSKRPEPKKKMKKSYQQEDEDVEESNDFESVMPQQQQQVEEAEEEVLKLPPMSTEYAQKKALPMKQKQAKFESEPFDMFRTKQPQSLPAKMIRQAPSKANYFAQEQYQVETKMLDIKSDDFPGAFVPLPPITSTENLNKILQTKLQSPTIKAFKVNQ